MNEDSADRINSAACRAWLFRNGLLAELSFADIGIIRSVSAAQIQTAADVVDADDQAKPAIDGKRTFRCTLDPDGAESLKRYVESLPAGPAAF